MCYSVTYDVYSSQPRRRTGSGDDAYLDAARAAILAVGWSRTTLTDIARRAGVSRMTLYRRWPDTQTLLADLMTREWESRRRRCRDRGADVPTARRRITTSVVATVRALRANDLVRRIVDVDPEVLLPYLLDRRGRSQEYVAEATAGLIAEGQRDGSVRAGDPTTHGPLAPARLPRLRALGAHHGRPPRPSAEHATSRTSTPS